MDAYDEIAKLHELVKQGILSQEEFEAKKRMLLNEGSSPKAASQRDDSYSRWANAISQRTLQGYRVIDRNDSALVAVLEKEGETVNHTLHAILTIFTCLAWAIVWAVMAGTAKKTTRIRISVDPIGQILEEKVG